MTPLYEPRTAPFRSMVSSPDPASLGQGEWPKAFNVRQRRGSLRVRWGHQKKTSAVPVAGAKYRGHWSGKLGGTEYAFFAFAVFSGATFQHIRIYKLDLSTFAWTEISNPTETPFGTVRLGVDGEVTMAPVRDTYSGKDVLVISNGTTEYPRVYDPSDATDYAMAIIKPSEYPNNNRSAATYGITGQFLRCHLNSTETAAMTTASTDADFAVSFTSDSLFSGKYYIAFEAAAADVNDAASVIWPSGQEIDATNLSYLTLLCRTTHVTWDTALKFEIYDRNQTTWRTIYDSADLELNRFVVVSEPELSTSSKTTFLLQLPLTPLTATERDSIGGFRITVKDAAVSTFSFDLLMFLLTAATPGNTQFGQTYYNPHSFTESAGMILTKGDAPKYSALGAPALKNRRIPEVTGMFYTYQVQTQNPTQGMADNGFEQVRIYERRPGEQDFTLSDFITTAAYNDVSNTWAVTGGAGLVTSTTLNTLNYLNRGSARFDVKMPSAFNTSVPRGAIVFSLNERLFVGRLNGAASELWISEYQNPMRFSPVLQFAGGGQLDDLSPVKLSFEGETVMGMAPLTGSVFGQSSAVLFTDRSTVPINGRTASSLIQRQRIGNHGCIHRGTIAVNDNTVFFVDSDLQLRVIESSSSTRPISRDKIDDRLKAGSWSYPAAYATDSQYQVSFKGKNLSGTADTLNKESLVLDVIDGAYSFDRVGEGDFAGHMLSVSATGTVVYGVTEEGHIYQLETEGQEVDGSTAFQTYIESSEIHNAQWQDLLIDEIGLHLRKNPANSLNLSINCDLYRPAKDDVVSGTFNFLSSVTGSKSGLRFAYKSANKSVFLGTEGTSAQIRIYGNIPGGTYIRSIVANIKGVAEGHSGGRP